MSWKNITKVFAKKDTEKRIKNMGMIVDTCSDFIELSFLLVNYKELQQSDRFIVHMFLFGMIDMMAQAYNVGDTQSVSIMASTVLFGKFTKNADEVGEIVGQMIDGSSSSSGGAAMQAGGQALQKFCLKKDPRAGMELFNLLKNPSR